MSNTDARWIVRRAVVVLAGAVLLLVGYVLAHWQPGGDPQTSSGASEWGGLSEPGGSLAPAIIPGQPAAPPEIPPQYRFIQDSGVDRDKIAATWDALPYTKIELERTECFGTCPSYIVTFNAGGSAHYVGRAYTAQTGEFDGEVDLTDYGRLCWLIERFDLLAGPQRYSANWTDAPTTLIRIQLRETGETIHISDYGDQGPVELWALFNAVDAVSGRIQWTGSRP
jgi:hypothetical protein